MDGTMGSGPSVPSSRTYKRMIWKQSLTLISICHQLETYTGTTDSKSTWRCYVPSRRIMQNSSLPFTPAPSSHQFLSRLILKVFATKEPLVFVLIKVNNSLLRKIWSSILHGACCFVMLHKEKPRFTWRQFVLPHSAYCIPHRHALSSFFQHPERPVRSRERQGRHVHMTSEPRWTRWSGRWTAVVA
jgi:hypothetical protein